MLNKDNFKVDILLATYNGVKYLEEQIQSIINQTYRNFDLIIADDASTDGTRDLLMKYAKLDERIKLLLHDKRLGAVKNFEKLVNISNSKYFMLSDQDDVWLPNKVEESIRFLRENRLTMVYTDLIVTDKDLAIISQSFWKREGIKGIKEDKWIYLLSQNIVTGCTVLVDNEIKQYLLPFPNSIKNHDWWISFVCSIYGKVGFIDQASIYYRQHESNLIGSQGFMSNSKQMNQIETYSLFLETRHRYISNQMEILDEILAHLKSKKCNKIICDTISKAKQSYTNFNKIKYMNVNPKNMLFKFKYPSQGFLRNIWWSAYYWFPIVSYIIIRYCIQRRGNSGQDSSSR